MIEELARITQVRKLLQTACFAAMATVNEDGSPHNSPFLFLHDDQFIHVYWGSHPASLHSKNILRTGQLFVVVFDAFKIDTGLYIRAENGHPLAGEELTVALKIHNAFRTRLGKPVLPLSYYAGMSPQRMWSAKITNVWVNSSERDESGFRIKDFRIEIKREDLVG